MAYTGPASGLGGKKKILHNMAQILHNVDYEATTPMQFLAEKLKSQALCYTIYVWGFRQYATWVIYRSDPGQFSLKMWTGSFKFGLITSWKSFQNNSIFKPWVDCHESYLYISAYSFNLMCPADVPGGEIKAFLISSEMSICHGVSLQQTLS